MNDKSYIFIVSGIVLLFGFISLIAFIVSCCRKRADKDQRPGRSTRL